MTLSHCLDEYVRHRRSLGVCFHGEQVRLSTFRRTVGDREIATVSPEAVRRYIDGRGPVTQAWLARYHTVNAFYRFAIRREYVTTAPVPRTKPVVAQTFVPYLYSDADMRRLLTAVDDRHEEDWLVRPATMRTLLLLLYASGLRISEVLALDMRDVDLRERLLTIRETKFYKSRLVPIGDDLTGVLRRYRDRQYGGAGRAPTDPFLSDHRHRRILRQTAELVFYRVRQQAGLDHPVGRSFRPRLHDLRHTFAMNRLPDVVSRGPKRPAVIAASDDVPRAPERRGNAALPAADLGRGDAGWTPVPAVRGGARWPRLTRRSLVRGSVASCSST